MVRYAALYKVLSFGDLSVLSNFSIEVFNEISGIDNLSSLNREIKEWRVPDFTGVYFT